ncbi:hypothetical protein FEAC_03840 [Ferrimicrobium acidiphilum DSM 19497]|uniref:Uncharacterized protein n=1 Tax=Ferrimicrobium acidiphilum DSM 19497 TaxID=1121877 RepID=A0A0D8FXY1_9ACTN|nr:hypothetical protein FEAC_03840 [Ferrimicrobium acidiphilum DSM 19497]
MRVGVESALKFCDLTAQFCDESILVHQLHDASLQLLDHLGLGRDFGLECLTVTHERRVTGLAHEAGLPSPRSLVRKFLESG